MHTAQSCEQLLHVNYGLLCRLMFLCVSACFSYLGSVYLRVSFFCFWVIFSLDSCELDCQYCAVSCVGRLVSKMTGCLSSASGMPTQYFKVCYERCVGKDAS